VLKLALPILISVMLSHPALWGQWLSVGTIEVDLKETKLGGPVVVLKYSLSDPTITPASPAYVFVRWSKGPGNAWRLLPKSELSGSGAGLVESPGAKEIEWWGTAETSFDSLEDVKFAVRAIRMARVSGGEFVMKSVPGGGFDRERVKNRVSTLPTFYMTISETTISMYVDYLNEVGGTGIGWNPRMERAGLERTGQSPSIRYSLKPGIDNLPITEVSWYDASAFLSWCGLSLPTEAEWEKAYRGGRFLDGDDSAQQPNPLPERVYPWGDEDPDEGGVFRCNARGSEDGFASTARVCSFAHYNSPYGICDLAGNVAEWTLDWYTTEYHAGLDGIRMVRGGSWRSTGTAVDAISGATSLPIKEGGITGFRGVRRVPANY